MKRRRRFGDGASRVAADTSTAFRGKRASAGANANAPMRRGCKGQKRASLPPAFRLRSLEASDDARLVPPASPRSCVGLTCATTKVTYKSASLGILVDLNLIEPRRVADRVIEPVRNRQSVVAQQPHNYLAHKPERQLVFIAIGAAHDVVDFSPRDLRWDPVKRPGTYPESGCSSIIRALFPQTRRCRAIFPDPPRERSLAQRATSSLVCRHPLRNAQQSSDQRGPCLQQH